MGGERIAGETRIADGEEIGLGLVRLGFRVAGREQETVDTY